MSDYDNDSDYAKPYHWLMKPWHITYGGMEYYEYAAEVMQRAANISPKRVLDVGCGDGRITEMLTQTTSADSLGIDISEKAIGHAKQHSKQASFKQISLQDFIASRPEKFDLITLIEVLEHLDKKESEKWLGLFKLLLDENGKILITVPTTNYPMIHPGHIRHFNRELMDEMILNTGFKIEKIDWLYDMRGGWVFSDSGLVRHMIRALDNKYWNVRFITKLLSDYHSRRYAKSEEAFAGRMLAVLVRSD